MMSQLIFAIPTLHAAKALKVKHLLFTHHALKKIGLENIATHVVLYDEKIRLLCYFNCGQSKM